MLSDRRQRRIGRWYGANKKPIGIPMRVLAVLKEIMDTVLMVNTQLDLVVDGDAGDGAPII